MTSIFRGHRQRSHVLAHMIHEECLQEFKWKRIECDKKIIQFTCTFKITSVKILTIDKRFGPPCTVHFFILYRIAIGELLNFNWKWNKRQHIICLVQSYEQQFVAQNKIYAPVWLFINLSVIFWMLEIRPYFANSCLTSWCKLMRGTPNTNKYFDSLTIVYTWNKSEIISTWF